MVIKPKDKKRILVTTKIDPELHKLLKVVAAEKGIRVYEVLEEAISEYIRKHKPDL
jgi:predicted HicB family RNase H-like nuclease